jgi:diacylglycerol kinase (ATP)
MAGMLTPSTKEMFMQNYLSIGVDALVTYNFSKARESPFYLIPSRIVNKFIYFM